MNLYGTDELGNQYTSSEPAWRISWEDWHGNSKSRVERISAGIPVNLATWDCTCTQAQSRRMM